MGHFDDILPFDSLDNYSVEDIESAIERCDKNIAIFQAKVDEQMKMKQEWKLALMQKTAEIKAEEKLLHKQ